MEFLEKVGSKNKHICEKCGNADMGKLFSGFSVGHGSNPVSQDNSSCPTGTCPLSQ